ncbi:MAG: sulfurtransferase [Austwickia sp.]|nr:sulfurtransferase [Austwickia sp.]
MTGQLLISASELDALINNDPGRAPLLLDVRWALGRSDGYEAYLDEHLPGAIFVDLEADLSGPVSEDGRGGRHPLPAIDDFEYAMAELGVDNHRPVVCYDDWNSLSAARCWWLLRHFGKHDVRVLDGGLKAWKSLGLPVECGPRELDEGDFEPRRSNAQALDADHARRYAAEAVLIDGRPADRFRGENETIDPVAGHIPGAVNLPALSLVDPDGRLLPASHLRAAFEAVGAADDRPVAMYCGSGVQASLLALAYAHAGLGEEVPVYVGSWSDWVSDRSRPVETALAPRP